MYVYGYVDLPTAKINQTSMIPPGELSQGGDSTIGMAVGRYGAACGCAERHGRGRQNGCVLIIEGVVFSTVLFPQKYSKVWATNSRPTFLDGLNNCKFHLAIWPSPPKNTSFAGPDGFWCRSIESTRNCRFMIKHHISVRLT